MSPSSPVSSLESLGPTTRHYTAVPKHDDTTTSRPKHATPQAKGGVKTFWDMVLRFGWWWDIGSILVATICICLIVAILFSMSNKPLSAWNSEIQPNSVISILTTVAKSALLVPVSECISQLTWIYFSERPRALTQIQVFHDASRGPWGSMVLLSKLRLKERSLPVLASLGSILTILLLTFEPFTQQVIEFPTRNTTVDGQFGRAPIVRGLPNSATGSLEVNQGGTYDSLI